MKKKKTLFDTNNKSNFKCIKTSLKSILRNYNENFPKINKLIIECNDIIIITYQFIKLHILYCYHNDKDIPELTENIISYYVRTCGFKLKGGDRVKNIVFQKELDDFYTNEFSQCINLPKHSLVNKKYTLAYLITQIHTSFYNNIKEHFLTRFRRFINLTIPFKLYDDNRQKIKENIKLSNTIKKSLLTNILDNNLNEDHITYFNFIKNEFLPKKFDKSHGYEVKVNPHKYLYYTIKMNDYLEKLNLNKNEDDKIKLFHAIPLRTSIIPKYITLDACGILNLLNIEISKYLKENPIKVDNNRIQIWNLLFNTNKKVLKLKNYEFKTIQTDGIGVSIIFQKIGKKLTKKELAEENKKDELYISDLVDYEIKACQNKTLIGGDPGKENLIYFINNENKTLRYTAIQRRKESQNKKYNNIIRNKKFKNNIIEKETILSDFNSKTVNYDLFKNYITAKTKLNKLVQEFYNEDKFRKFKWRTCISQRQSEDKFLQKIENTYGKDLLICYGNWSNSKQMKYIMPTKGIGLRKVISKKFNTVLVDEYKTSKICNKCHKELTNLKKDNKKIHRILVCTDCISKSSESKKVTYINRDINGSKNILNLSVEWLKTQTRNLIFSRKINQVP